VKLLADEILPPAAASPAKTPAPPAAPPHGQILDLKADAAAEEDPPLPEVRALLEQYPGEILVRIKLERSGRWIEVHRHLRVTLAPELLTRLATLLGPLSVVVR
jgi:hypothetical protein